MERISNSELPAGILDGMMKTQNYLNNSGLDRTMLELMVLRVSQLNSCAYCLDMHFKEATSEGETGQRLISVSAWREAPYYSDKERAVLAFAETLTKMPADVHSDGLHDELQQYFSKQEIAQITLAVV